MSLPAAMLAHLGLPLAAYLAAERAVAAGAALHSVEELVGRRAVWRVSVWARDLAPRAVLLAAGFEQRHRGKFILSYDVAARRGTP